MDQLRLMKVFATVADAQGFAAAARRLDMSPPAVTRAITQLESHLGIRLLNRTTRSVRVTESGTRYLQDVRRILEDVAAADAAATGINAEPRGKVTVTAPVLFGRMHIMPGIIDFLRRYPDTEVDAIFLDRTVNLLEEGIDVGVRIGTLEDSSMRALRVGAVRRVVCAAPAYLAEHGTPGSPDDLRRHTTIASRAGDLSRDWTFHHASARRTVRLKPRLTVTTNDAAIAGAIAGLGIARVLSYQVADAVAAGQLQLLLTEHEPPPLPVHILHREDGYPSAKVRAFIDLMAERLRGNQ